MNDDRRKMNDNTMVLIIIGLLVLMMVIGFFIFRFPEEEDPEESDGEVVNEEESEEEEEEELTFEEKKKEVVEGFVGEPYESSPLDEERLYTEEGFDSTTLILSLAAKTNAENDPEEEMKRVNYYPPENVNYENRLHFSSFRNEVSDYFNPITEGLTEDHIQEKEIVLNKEYEEGERLIDIDWQKEVTLSYIPSEYVIDVLNEVPSVAGVMFIMEGDEDIGLDVRSEGIMMDGTDIVYSSSEKGEVVEMNFVQYLEDSEFDGVTFFEFNEVN